MRHTPVMLDQVLASLCPQDHEVYVDGTFGGGGYTRAVLQAANCTVYGIDRDLDAIERGEALASQNSRFTPVLGRFGQLDRLLGHADVQSVDGIMLDIGVSSYQLDQAERGFSFMRDGPLDMRMGQTGPSAADIVNHMPEAELARLIYILGDEKQSRRIARALSARRSQRPFTHTLDLADFIGEAIGGRRGRKTHPATRTFQALRIFINDELGELARGLVAAEKVLKPDGRLIIVTFHSLEDRLVKRFLRERCGRESKGSRYRPLAEPEYEPSFELIHNKALTPSEEEISGNPRARSAHLRAARRCAAPAWPQPFSHELSLPRLELMEGHA